MYLQYMSLTSDVIYGREHDKGPEEFCTVILKLLDEKLPFAVSILGSHTNDIPGEKV